MCHPRRPWERANLSICTKSLCYPPTISCGTRNTFQLFIHLTIYFRFRGTPVPTSRLLGTCHSPLLVLCAGFAALAVIYMKLRASAWEGEYGYANAAIDSMLIMLLFVYLLIPGVMTDVGEHPFWNTLTLAFAVILLWSLTLVAYIASFKFVKKPSRFQMRLARYVMAPVFFLTAMSVYVVLSGGRWATLSVAPLCVLLVLSTMLLAVELSAQAYKGREVPVWRYRASYMMGGAILLMYLVHFIFDCLPHLFR